ncbi:MULTISPECIES: EAL domain-containing protein [unclassified Caballeronia]|uniref:bifunctional diguanylate cyclase/phosphodiesterase n=1 Tax=unclassified Caballeronia TaxID=2646786 RepID=UPI00285B65D6|nr:MULTISPECIES: EAL domain-containing protein [unclassified Caballeronia]MDR5754125.1 EAL domain-containing protein [Caballeronia sp. LZ024]MDR5840503.1 EAL domain-containing protein [Caballeronia sp. LZ031]
MIDALPDTNDAMRPDAGAPSIDALLDAARGCGRPGAWAWYRAGEQLHLAGQGDASFDWPQSMTEERFAQLCAARGWHRWATGRGESVLGWLVAPEALAGEACLRDLARRLGERVQADALVRAQNTQRVLYEIAYLASSVPERAAFLQGVHERLGTLIDAENFYLALYDRKSGRITYPYYVDVIDTEVVAAENYDILNPARLSMTGHVLTTGQPLLIDAAMIRAAEAEGRFYCIGDRPEFWMGAPLKNASDEVFGMLAMQVYDVSRVYSAEDRALFLVVARHVAMALDRILHRADLEEQVARRTSELSRVNAALREGIAERERAEHLQAALFQIAELSSRPGDMVEFFRSLHGIVGELLYARNFYIALFDTDTREVSFPYYVDEIVQDPPPPRRGQRGLTEYVIRQRRPCLIDADEARRLIAGHTIDTGNENVRLRSWLGIPLFDGDDVRGVLAVQSYAPLVRYSQRDQELLTFVSRHIDTALSRRRAAEALHVANAELEARVQIRTRELDNANARLLHENSHDSLTGLPNRSHLLQQLQAAWRDYRTYGDQVTVMFIDLDRFKVVNDSLGHHYGDLLLIQAAGRLRDCLRSGDLLARLGGDEFAVLSPNTSQSDAVAIAERILAAFDLPFHIDEHVVFSSCSIGIVSADSQFHTEPADLLRDADTAMYRVKNAGRDSFVVFNQELRREVSDQVEREGALRNALKRDDELLPYFQPIVDVRSGEVVALEALIRWRQSDGRIVGPGEFLPAVEGLRLIGRLDLYMLTRVAVILSDPRFANWPPVHVNCSSYSMTRPDFADDVLALLRHHGVAPSRVCLELTEGALVAEPDLARRTMQQLADNGMSVVLDDFGAGFSSLSYVHQYRFSGLKIDKSFILELTASARSRAIVRAIVRMAESLDLTLVAEGVEDAETLAVLRDMGAAQAQGYFFDKPMPLDALMRSPAAGRLAHGYTAAPTPLFRASRRATGR